MSKKQKYTNPFVGTFKESKDLLKATDAEWKEFTQEASAFVASTNMYQACKSTAITVVAEYIAAKQGKTIR